MRIDQLRAVGVQLSELERRKAVAVRRDTALTLALTRALTRALTLALTLALTVTLTFTPTR